MNLEPDSTEMSNFIESHSLFNHMKEKTCWKSPEGSCIDLILSNKKHSVFNTGTIETGLSDHHSLVYSMLKNTFQKLPPSKISYRKWKHFDARLFNFELAAMLPSMKTEFSSFNSIFTSILDKHAPKKIKFLRGNNQLFMTKELRKAIMKRSKLKNIARKSKDPEDWAAYRRQRNLVVNLNRHAKKTFFANSLPTSKSFWKKVKPLFSSKNTVDNERILLVENGEIVQDEELLAKVFNEFFNGVTDNLDIHEIPSSQVFNTFDPVSIAVAK